jgi:hypothetical protein
LRTKNNGLEKERNRETTSGITCYLPYYRSYRETWINRRVTVRSEGGEARWVPPSVIGSLARMIDTTYDSSAEVPGLQRVFPQLHATLFVQKLNYGFDRVRNAVPTTDRSAGGMLTLMQYSQPQNKHSRALVQHLATLCILIMTMSLLTLIPGRQFMAIQPIRKPFPRR